MERRDEILDIAKGIAIILVVIGHIYIGESKYAYYLKTFIYSFHLPLFFLVSGLLFNPDKIISITDFFKSRFKGLIYPYITFSIFAYVIWLGFEASKSDGNIHTLFIEPFYFWILGLRGGSNYVFTGAYWFLICLFMVELCFYSVLKYISRSSIFLFFFSFLLAGIGYAYNRFGFIQPIPFSIDLIPLGLFFFISGFLFKKSGAYFILTAKSTDFKLLIIGLSSILIMLLCLENGAIDMYSNKLGKVPFLFSITGLLGGILVILVSSFLGGSVTLNYLGKASLIVLLVHQQIVIHPLNCIFWPFNKEGKELYFLIILYYMTTFLTCIILIEIINTRIPWLIRPFYKINKVN